MLNVTDGFKEAIIGVSRKMLAKAVVSIIDPDITYGESNGSGAAPWSKPAQLHDKTLALAPRYGTLEPGRWPLDGTVVLLRKTIYRDSADRGELEEGNALTHAIGVFLNGLENLLNKTIWKEHEHKKDLEHWFVLRYAAFKENATVIGRSLSYGLVLFCMGLCATLIYLLITAFQ